MSGMDDLHKSLGMFTDGLNQLAINTGIKNATDQVDSINSSMTDELQKRQAKTQLAQQLALHMTSFGANPAAVQQATGAIAPPKIDSSSDAYQQAVATGDPKMMSMAKQMQSFENVNPMAIQGLKNTGDANVANIKGQYEVKAAETRLGADQKKRLQGMVGKFNSEAKPMLETFSNLDNMVGLLNDKTGASDTAFRSNLARTIGNEKGRIPIQEIQQYSGSPDVASRLERFADQNINGIRFTDQDRADFQQMLTNKRDVQQKALTEKIQQYAGQGPGESLGSEKDVAAALVGSHPRMKEIFNKLYGDQQAASQPGSAGAAGAPAQPAASAPSTVPPGFPQGTVAKTMIDPETSKPFVAYVTPDGKTFKPSAAQQAQQQASPQQQAAQPASQEQQAAQATQAQPQRKTGFNYMFSKDAWAPLATVPTPAFVAHAVGGTEPKYDTKADSDGWYPKDTYQALTAAADKVHEMDKTPRRKLAEALLTRIDKAAHSPGTKPDELSAMLKALHDMTKNAPKNRTEK
jgi:hypothetical protein